MVSRAGGEVIAVFEKAKEIVRRASAHRGARILDVLHVAFALVLQAETSTHSIGDKRPVSGNAALPHRALRIQSRHAQGILSTVPLCGLPTPPALRHCG